MSPKKTQEKALTSLPFERIEVSVEHLNQIFTPLGWKERIHLLYAYFQVEEVLVTSSFGAQSAYLLYLLYQLQPRQSIHFLDTGYHFPETLAYKETLTRKWSLHVVDIHPEAESHARTREGQWWQQRSDRCCAVNKVEPLERIKGDFRVWLSGVMGFQTSFRAGLRVFEPEGELLKFHPLIDLDAQSYTEEMQRLDLPGHPLLAQGYASIGCTHCTSRAADRSGRWQGTDKTECGLHTGYLQDRLRKKSDDPS